MCRGKHRFETKHTQEEYPTFAHTCRYPAQSTMYVEMLFKLFEWKWTIIEDQMETWSQECRPTSIPIPSGNLKVTLLTRDKWPTLQCCVQTGRWLEDPRLGKSCTFPFPMVQDLQTLQLLVWRIETVISVTHRHIPHPVPTMFCHPDRSWRHCHSVQSLPHRWQLPLCHRSADVLERCCHGPAHSRQDTPQLQRERS